MEEEKKKEFFCTKCSLQFDNNFISGNLTSGGVPSEIGLLGNLEILSLAHNFLTIPNPAIYSLINLEELYLNNNQIYYIDNDLGNLEDIAGFAFRDEKGKVKINTKQELVDYENLPMPAWDQLDFSEYHQCNNHYL